MHIVSPTTVCDITDVDPALLMPELDHPYMSLYLPVLLPRVSSFDPDEEASETNKENEAEAEQEQEPLPLSRSVEYVSPKSIRTSPLQKTPVQYSTRIYCTPSAAPLKKRRIRRKVKSLRRTAKYKSRWGLKVV